MYKSKLVKILKTLPPEDFKRFNKMLRSPLYTSNPSLPLLYSLLRKHYPEFNSSRLVKEKVFKKLFPDLPYSDIKLRNLMREMTKLLEDFLIHLELQRNSLQRDQLLSRIYGQRKLHRFFEKSIYQLQHQLNESPYRDATYFRQSFELKHNLLSNFPIPDLNQKSALFRETEEDLDQLYAYHKLWFECEGRNFNALYAGGRREELEKQKQKLKVEAKSPLYQLYSDIIQLQETKKDTLFEQIKNQFFEQIQHIRPPSREEIFGWLNNYLVGKMKEDDQHYNQLTLDFYKTSLQHGILSQESNLINSFYLNILTCSAKAKDFEWAQQFMLEYDQYLTGGTRGDIKNLGLAYLYFHQQRFSKAVDLLADYHFVHPLYALSARIHHLRCCFELFLTDSTYYDLLIAQSQAFERLVRRHQMISKAKVAAYLNFAQFIRKLAAVRLKGKINKEEKMKFKSQLEKQKITMSRSWLLEKIDGN